MRRMLCLLPALAVVACQADVPTDADTMQAQEVDGQDPPDTWLAYHGLILEDAVVNTESDRLEFYVKNPGYGMPPCAEGVSYWIIEGIGTPQRDHFAIAEHNLTWAECNETIPYWPLYTKDAVRDFAFSIVGSTVCDALKQHDGGHIDVYGKLFPVASPEYVLFSRTFRVQCPYLD